MTGLLDRLAERAVGTAFLVQPRLRSMFEPETPFDGGTVEIEDTQAGGAESPVRRAADHPVAPRADGPQAAVAQPPPAAPVDGGRVTPRVAPRPARAEVVPAVTSAPDVRPAAPPAIRRAPPAVPPPPQTASTPTVNNAARPVPPPKREPPRSPEPPQARAVAPDRGDADRPAARRPPAPEPPVPAATDGRLDREPVARIESRREREIRTETKIVERVAGPPPRSAVQASPPKAGATPPTPIPPRATRPPRSVAEVARRAAQSHEPPAVARSEGPPPVVVKIDQIDVRAVMPARPSPAAERRGPEDRGPAPDLQTFLTGQDRDRR